MPYKVAALSLHCSFGSKFSYIEQETESEEIPISCYLQNVLESR